MMLGMTAGSMVGHLATRCFGQYDLPIPRPPSDELPILVGQPRRVRRGVEARRRRPAAVGLPPRDRPTTRCSASPTCGARLEELLAGLRRRLRDRPGALEHQLGDLDPTSTRRACRASSSCSATPRCCSAPSSPLAQRELLPRLEALVAVIVGYVDHVMDRIGGRLISSYAMVTEAVRRRRVEARPVDRFVERLFGLELTQDRVRPRRARSSTASSSGPASDGLDRLWESSRDAADAGRGRRPRPLARPHRPVTTRS